MSVVLSREVQMSVGSEVLLDDAEMLIQEDRWHEAIEALEGVFPYWHHHAARLHLTMTRGWCATAAVDGVKLYWNPEFTASLSDRELLFLLAHEVFHVANGHIWRGARYQKGLEGSALRKVLRRLNLAADYAIHQILVPLVRKKAYRKMKFPTGKNRGIYDKRFYNMSMEQIYEFLLNNPYDKANGKPQNFDVHIFRGTGDPADAPEGAMVDEDGNWVLVVNGNGGPVEISQEAKDAGEAPKPMNPKKIQIAIRRDLKAAEEGSSGSGEEAGKGTGTAQRTATPQADQVKDDWSILTQFIVMNAMADYSYGRPNRSYLSRGLIVPGLKSSTINIVIVVDTSGSIKKEGLNLFASNVELIRKQLGDHTLTLIFCDDSIRGNVDVYDVNQEVVWATRGGGGTSFKPPFEWVDNNLSDPPSCLVYFTDGKCGGDRPDAAPAYPVLWALWGPKQHQPWGMNLPLKDL
jgi:predicted metal-dependent peptidase